MHIFPSIKYQVLRKALEHMRLPETRPQPLNVGVPANRSMLLTFAGIRTFGSSQFFYTVSHLLLYKEISIT